MDTVDRKLLSTSLSWARIDDIEDGSVMRRGRPCAHLVFGTAATINSGNYYYFKFIEQMIEVCPQEKLQAVLQEVIKLFKRLHEVGCELDRSQKLVSEWAVI